LLTPSPIPSLAFSTSEDAPSWAATDLKLDDWVDILDQMRWRLGQIVAVDGDTLTVKMKGWHTRYNQTLPRSSRRLAKARSKTAGQDTRGYVVQGAQFDVDMSAVQSMEMRIDDFMAGEFPEESKVG
jgi:hypothetical protein